MSSYYTKVCLVNIIEGRRRRSLDVRLIDLKLNSSNLKFNLSFDFLYFFKVLFRANGKFL